MTKTATWKAIIAQWEQSKRSQKAFCKEQGLSLHCFKYWRYKLLKEQKCSSPVKIVQIQSNPSGSEKSPPFFLRFQKWELSIASNFDDRGLVRLLDVLEHR